MNIVEHVTEMVTDYVADLMRSGDKPTIDEVREYISEDLDRCLIYTQDIVDAWVQCGYPETPELFDNISSAMCFAILEYVHGEINADDILAAARAEVSRLEG